MSIEALAILCVSSLSCAVVITAYAIGKCVGEQRGRDLQWAEDFIEAGKREQARHRKNGQFKRRGEV